MSNLVKILSDSMILNESYSKVNNFIAMLLGKIQAIAGQVIEPEIFDITIQELVKDLRTNYKGYSLLEVEYVLCNGAKGKYGDFYGLNLKTFTKWLDDYQFSPERLEALQQKNKIEASKQLTVQGSITQEESNRLSIDKTLDDFNSYKAHRSIIDLGCTTYSFLVRIGLIQLSNKEKWDLLYEAKRLTQKEKDSHCQPIYKVARISFREKECQKNKLIRLSKNLALKRYFDSIITESIDFEKLLNQYMSSIQN